MKKSIKEKPGKIKSSISIVAVLSMIIIFMLNLPEMLQSSAGCIFAGVWALTAMLIFAAHTNCLYHRRNQDAYNIVQYVYRDELQSRKGMFSGKKREKKRARGY